MYLDMYLAYLNLNLCDLVACIWMDRAAYNLFIGIISAFQVRTTVDIVFITNVKIHTHFSIPQRRLRGDGDGGGGENNQFT